MSKARVKMPKGSPDWLQPYQLEFFGGFALKWQEYQTEDGSSFWYNKELNTSTWDNPITILCALLQNSVESSLGNEVRSWKTVDNTPFVKIRVKKGVGYWYHRMNGMLLTENPF